MRPARSRPVFPALQSSSNGQSEFPGLWSLFFFFLVNLSIFLAQRGCCERNWSCYTPCFDTVCKGQDGRPSTRHSTLGISLQGPMRELSGLGRGLASLSSEETSTDSEHHLTCASAAYRCLWCATRVSVQNAWSFDMSPLFCVSLD